jgi:hypothetical protein
MRHAASITASQRPVWLNATGLLLASFFAIAVLALQPRAGAEVVAVVFPPWWDQQQTLAATASAEAAIVRTTAVPSVLVVRPSDHLGLARLRDAGAWLAVDPRAIAACFTPQLGP